MQYPLGMGSKTRPREQQGKGQWVWGPNDGLDLGDMKNWVDILKLGGLI